MVKIGYSEGVCPRCGRTLKRQRPVDVAVCGCWEYCPQDHGRGAYGTLMEAYVPDMTASTYSPIVTEGTAWGDLGHPMRILRKCPVCNYHSEQKPIEVELE